MKPIGEKLQLYQEHLQKIGEHLQAIKQHMEELDMLAKGGVNFEEKKEKAEE